MCRCRVVIKARREAIKEEVNGGVAEALVLRQGPEFMFPLT